MPVLIEPFVFEVTTTIGTSDLGLTNQTGFRTFSSARGTGTTNQFHYFVRHETQSEYEHGLGHIDTGSGDLVRDRVIKSSNSDTLVNFTTGTKQITLDISTEDIGRYDAMLGTGLLDPENDGLVTINGGDNSKFDISAGVAQFADAYTDPDNPTVTRVSFGPFTAQTVTEIADDSGTFLYVDNTGAIVQKDELQKDGFLRDHVGVGILQHGDNVTISDASSFTPVGLNNITMALADLSFCMGAINCPTGGNNIVSGNSGTLSIDKTAGVWYFHSINVRTDAKSPNQINSAALTAPTIIVGWTVTDNAQGKFVPLAAVPAGVYDDGTAVLADALPQGTLANNSWANHRVFFVVDSNILAVQIGAVTYNSLANAQAGIASENFTPIPVLAGTTPICTLTMRGGATDLSIIADAEFRQANPPRATFT